LRQELYQELYQELFFVVVKEMWYRLFEMDSEAKFMRRVCFSKACAFAALMACSGLVFTPVMVPVAQAQNSQDFVLDNLVLDFAGQVMTMKQVSVEGSSLSRADFLTIMDAKATEPLASRLAKLNVKSIRIPEMMIEKTTRREKQVMNYKDVLVSNIVEGRMESVVAQSGTLAVTRGNDVMKGTFGPFSLTQTDMPQIARVSMDSGDQKKPEELKALYKLFSMRDLAFIDPKKTEVRITEISGSDFRARPIEGSWQNAIPKMEALEEIKDESTKVATSMKFLSDVFGAVSIGSLEMKGLEAVNKQADNAVFSLKRLGYSNGTVTLEGFGVVAKDAKANITEIVIGNFINTDLAPALKELAEKPLDQIKVEEWRKLMVMPGLIRFSGLDFDLPASNAKVNKEKRIHFTLKALTMTADKPFNNIPTDMGMKVENFNFTIPDGATDKGLKDMLAMGYKTLNVSMGLAAQWSEPSSELMIRDISLSGADMGSFALSGLLGNITKDAFNPDSAVSMVALLGANAKNISFQVENKGLYEKILTHVAKQQNTTADELRRQYGMMASIALPSFLGDSEQAKSIVQAVSRFIAKPGTLKLDLKAKEGGIGFADYAAAEQPADLLKKVDVKAVAE
jgi:hypothetical protein